MRAATLAVMCLAAPISAQEAMTQAHCSAGVAALSRALLPGTPQETRDEIASVSSALTNDGWCRIALPDNVLERGTRVVEWRASAVTQALASGGFPDRLDVRVPELRPAEGPLAGRDGISLEMSLVRGSSADTISVRADLDDLGHVEGEMTFGGMMWDSAAMRQMSLGSVRMQSAAVTVIDDGLTREVIWPAVMENQPAGSTDTAIARLARAQLRRLLGYLPADFLDQASEQALKEIGAGLPRNRGKLEADIAFAPGVGVLTISAFFGSDFLAADNPDQVSEATIRNTFDVLLGGAVAHIDWTPE